jgi:hypothetical protein
LALRAIISQGAPDPAADWEELWYGGVGAFEDEEGSGITTAAILSFLPDTQPGVWYALDQFDAQIRRADWNQEAEGWTSLTLAELTLGATVSFTTDIQLAEAVSSICLNVRDLLVLLKRKHVWVRFE